ncbi:transcriptional regulator [Actinorhabdospora filicis]|uniref:Transcriptional regulator n=1 Tax=Actinorhabdospora filicis TaxID=1785913 RepID=A0A9W6WCA7_9ACTN|nr:transcriptional regulator [Actinorhabdospora filicis]
MTGLRREEVARLARVSVEYVVRLEQGRGPRPSPQVLGALSRALRLTPADRDLVYRLAGAEPPRDGRVPMTVLPGTTRVLDRLGHLPALVLSAKSDVLAWNPTAAALLGDPATWPPDRRNLVRARFLNGGTTTGEDAAHCAGALRAAHSRYPGDPDLTALITDLRTGSPAFAHLWTSGRSGGHHSATAVIDHPRLGPLTLDCDVLHVAETDQSVLVYSARPGSAAAKALAELGTPS